VLLCGRAVFAQTAPNIHYNGGTNAVTFTDGTAGSFSPANSGGTVPALAYGTVTTPYGSTTGASGYTNATGNLALFHTEETLIGDGVGNLYVADFLNNVIRKIVVSTGTVTTFAGTGTAGITNGSSALTSAFYEPIALCLDPGGTNLYVGELSGGNGDIRKINLSTGVVSTFVPTPTGDAFAPYGLTTDASGTNLYYSDLVSNTICKVLISNGVVTTYAGNGTPGSTNSATLTSAEFNGPMGIAFDASGDLFVAEYYNNDVREINATSGVTLFAGSAAGTAGATNGTGTGAEFSELHSITLDPAGNMYLADDGNDLIRKVTPGAVVTTFAGEASTPGTTNGTTFTTSTLGFPGHMWIDGFGNLYVPDYIYNNIRQLTICGYAISGTLPAGVTFDGTTGTLSGTATVTGTFPVTITAYNFYGKSNAAVTITCNPSAPNISYSTPNGYAIGRAMTTLSPTNAGGAVTATTSYSTTGTTVLNAVTNGLNQPYGMGADPTGNVYVVNYGGKTVTEYSTAGVATTYSTNVPAGPVGITFDSSGNAYVLGESSETVVKFTGGMSGTTSTIVTGTTAPTAIAIDASNNLFVANIAGANRVQKYTSSGTPLLTIIGSATYPMSAGIGVDASDNLWVADNHLGSSVDEYNSAGTLVQELSRGSANSAIYIDGANNDFLTTTTGEYVAVYTPGWAAATQTITPPFSSPRGVVTDHLGNIYVSDYTTETVKKYAPTSGYFLAGTLPPGLSFSSTTGAITGTPTAVFSGSYSVTAYNVTGKSTSNTFTINCGYAPSISYNTPDDYLVNTGITALTPGYTTGTVSGAWSVSPSLPAGLTLNTSTGVITGTPTVLSSPTNYTVTTSNQYGSTSTMVNITVYSAPAFSYSPNPVNYPVNVAITPLTPAVTAGPVIPYRTNGWNFTPITFETGLTTPWGIASDANGNVYVTSYTGNTIVEYNSSGTALGTYTTTANVPGVTVDPSGNVYALLANGNIYKYTSFGAGTLLTSTIYNYVSAEGGNLTEAGYGIASDASGNLYITDNYDSVVWKYTAATGICAILVPAGTTGISGPSGIAVNSIGNIYIDNVTNGAVVVCNSSGTYQSETCCYSQPPYSVCLDAVGDLDVGMSPDRGITIDPSYNIYYTDYAAGTVTKLTPNFYQVTAGGALPPGITFNTTTGTFSGMPTAAFGPVTYTISAYGYNWTTGSTSVTISCYNSYDWTGAASSDWNLTTNWEAGLVPGSGNTANIGVNYAFTNQPVIGFSGATSINVGAIQIGNSGGQAAMLTVNSGYTLNVVTTSGGSGTITKQSDANSLQAFATGSSLAGAGTITAVNLDVIGSTTLGSSYTETFSSSVASLQLSGAVNLTSGFSAYAQNAAFNLTGGIASVTGPLTTTNAAGGTSTFGIVPTATATLQLANSTPLSGLSAIGTNVTNFNNSGATIEYSGAAQTFYTDAAVTNLSNIISYQNIKFSGTGVKSPTGGNLNVAGDFTNAMANDATDYVTLTGTPVYFNGAGPQNIYAGAGTGTVFNNLTFNGSGATTIQSGMAYVDDAGTLTMAGTATLAAGGLLTLNSDATGTAAIAPISSGTPITGTVNVQRYISAERGYRLLSSPVNAGSTGNGTYSINYLLNSLYLTGSGTGFTHTGNPSLYLYDEGFVPQYSTFYNSNFIAVSSMSSGTGSTPTYPVNVNGAGLTGSYSIPVGNGYYCFYRGNLSEGTSDLTNPAYSGVLPSTVTASGTLNQGSITFTNWFAGTSYLGGISQHYNLIGNPYASAIDLATVQSATTTSGIYITPYSGGAGITHFVYELKPSSNVYSVYNLSNPGMSTNNASEYIASGQGFFVEAHGTTSRLVFNESAKATSTNANTPGFMNKRVNNVAAINTGGANPVLRLKMSLDTINNEETLVSFSPTAQTGFVVNEDAAHKAGEGLVGFTSISSDNVPLAINMLPLAATQTIPLRTVATNDGLYNISLSQDAPLPALYDIWLMDAYKKDSLDIKNNPTYNFDILHSDTNSFGDHRFSLVIRQNQALMVHLLSFNAIKATGGDNVIWITENEARYTHFAVQRSTDGGQTFTTLDSLVSSGLGNYSYLDNKPVQGANSYRLRLTDLNDNITYSNVVTIMYANTGNQVALNGFMVYPNPTAGAFNLSINQPTATATAAYTIQIVNNLGVVLKTAQSSSPQWQTDVSALVPGTYFITVMNTNTNTLVGRSAFVKL